MTNPIRATLEDRRRERIADWLSQGTEAVTFIGVCETWIRDLIVSGREPHTRHELLGLPDELSPVARLGNAGFRAYADAMEWQISCGVGAEPREASLVGHALAVASGRAYATRDPGKLRWIGRLVSTVDSRAWEAFADSAAAAIADDVDRCGRFDEFLSGIVREANDAPDSVTEVPLRGTSTASIVEQFQRNGSFQAVWQADLSPVLFRSTEPFEIFRRASPERFLELVDELPHPALVGACLSSRALRESPGEVMRLLRLAGLSFDADGCWRRTGMAAILLLRTASEQLLSAGARPGDEDDFGQASAEPADSQEGDDAGELAKRVTCFRDAADALLDALFVRPDGAELGWHWLENLLRQLPPRHSQAHRNRPCKVAIDHIGILVRALSARLAPRRTDGEWIASVHPVFRQYRAIAVLSVAAFSAEADDLDVGAVAVELLKQNRFNLTRAAELVWLPGAPLRTVSGQALARIPDVASWFTKTWLGLRCVREQAWRRAQGQGGVDSNPAEIMGVWGLGMLEALAAAAARCYDARAMWHALEAVFREARLVEPRPARDFWSPALAHLFAWWPHLFVRPLPTAQAEFVPAEPLELSRALAPYIGITRDFMGIIISLHQNGSSVTSLDRAVSEVGYDLRRMINRFLTTARGLRDARVWNQDWVAALGRVKMEIVAQRSETAGAPAAK